MNSTQTPFFGSSNFSLANASSPPPAAGTPAILLDIQNVLNYVDIVIRVITLLVHLVYFLIVLTHRELKSLSLLLMHHIIFIGVVNSINYVAWINQTTLSIKDPFWNNFVCSLDAATWFLTKIGRPYSILMLGIYRYFAVYKINFYKKISQSWKWMIAGCLCPWVIALVIFLASQNIAHTSYSPTLCTDGASSNVTNVIIYNAISQPLGYVVPIVLVLVFFILVSRRLNEMNAKLGKKKQRENKHLTKLQSGSVQNKPSNGGSNLNGDESSRGQPSHPSLLGSSTLQDISTKRKQNRVERKLAFQFITINILEFFSALTFNLIIVFYFQPSLNTNFYYIRQLLRISSNIFLNFIPVITLVYHPFKLKIPFLKN